MWAWSPVHCLRVNCRPSPPPRLSLPRHLQSLAQGGLGAAPGAAAAGVDVGRAAAAGVAAAMRHGASVVRRGRHSHYNCFSLSNVVPEATLIAGVLCFGACTWKYRPLATTAAKYYLSSCC